MLPYCVLLSLPVVQNDLFPAVLCEYEQLSDFSALSLSLRLKQSFEVITYIFFFVQLYIFCLNVLASEVEIKDNA